MIGSAPPLKGKVGPLPAGCKGFDCYLPPSPEQLRKMHGQGFRFVVLYCDASEPEDLQNVLAAGMALMLVQTGNRPGWVPGPEGRWGGVRGHAAAADAQRRGYLPGACLFCDVESLAPGASVEDLVLYDKAWAAEVTRAGFVPGRYEGCAAILDGEALYHRLPYQHYWRSASKVPDVAHRGYQMLQGGQVNVGRTWAYDPDTVQMDRQGGLPLAVLPEGWTP